MNQADGRWLVGMKAGLHVVEQGSGGRLGAIDIGPEPVASQFLFEKAPDPLDQVEGRRVDREPERDDPSFLRRRRDA